MFASLTAFWFVKLAILVDDILGAILVLIKSAPGGSPPTIFIFSPVTVDIALWSKIKNQSWI